MTSGILYRPHSGGLAEAMAEVREIASRSDLVELLRADLSRVGIAVTDEMVRVENYGGMDHRISWDTHIVLIEGWGPIGFTNAPL